MNYSRRVIALVGLATTLPLLAGDDADLSARVDAIFSPLNNSDTPGCAVGVIRNGEFVHKAGYGMANLELDVRISPDSVFRIASVSKQFTAAAVLLLADDGLIDLDDDIRKYLPDLAEYQAKVSIRDLLAMTSGIPDYELELVTGDDIAAGSQLYNLKSVAGGPYRMGNEDYLSIPEFYDAVKVIPLSHPPGTKFDYSNTNYFLLSMLVEAVTGQTLRSYAKEKIFVPLGMNNTLFHDDMGDIIKNRATGYKEKEGGGYLTDMTNLYTLGDGGLHTSINDFIKWDRNFYDPRLGKDPAAFRDLMNTPNSDFVDEGWLYGNGQNIESTGDGTIYSHDGGWLGFTAYYIRYQDRGLSVVTLCNNADLWPSKLSEEVIQLYLESNE